jgi:hypothetical protein
MKTIKSNKICLKNLVEDWNFSAVVLYVSLKLLIFIYRILPISQKDGWRKTTEVHHRNDEAKYIGSLHNLAVQVSPALSKTEAHSIIIGKLQSVFIHVTDLHYALRWKANACIRIPYQFSDIMEVSYDASGTLNNLVFHPDIYQPITASVDDSLKDILLEEIQKAYNETYLLQDKKRSLQLYRLLHRRIIRRKTGIAKNEWITFLERMLSATWISFYEEEADADSRMTPHLFTYQKHAGFGLLNIHCKHAAQFQWMDIWMQFSHIGIDGRAAAKLQGRISSAFGLYNPEMTFPRDFKFHNKFFIYKYPDRNVFHGCSFIDFGTIITAANKLPEKYGKVLPVALLIWGLAKQPLFKNLKFNIPVDIPASDLSERTVGFVFIKPETFCRKYPEDEAFARFNHSFNEQVKGVRNRHIENYYLMQTATMVPHRIIALMLRYLPAGLFTFTGTTCVTLMEGIEYAIPSLSDNINTIIAVSLITKDNNKTACVSIRADSDIAERILSEIQEAVHNIPRIFYNEYHQEIVQISNEHSYPG